MVDFGRRMRQLRKAKGLTQSQVAELVGGTKVMISSYELGTRFPPYSTLVKLARLYGVSTDYLLGVVSHRTLNVDGLSNEHILLLKALIEALRDRTLDADDEN